MINVALIGLGKMGISHFAILNAHKGVNLVAVCDSSKFVLDYANEATGVKTYSDYKKLLQKETLDAVVVATPSSSHAKIVKECLDLKLHIFCEKPFCLDPAVGRSLAEIAIKERLVNQVGYHYRFVGAFLEAKRLIEQGAIGTVHNIRAEAYGPVVLRPKGKSWRSNKNEGGGCLYDYACHAIDLMNFCVGKPEGIRASSLNSVFSNDVDDEVYALFEYEDGTTGQLLSNWSDESFRKMSTKVHVWGTNGRITADRQEVQMYLRQNTANLADYHNGWNVKYTTELTAPVEYYLRGEEYSRQIDYFVESILTNRIDGENTFRSAVDTDQIAKSILDANSIPSIPIEVQSNTETGSSKKASFWKKLS